jgi:hypothetical protein
MNRIFSVAAAVALAAMVGCDDGSDADVQTTDQEIITQPGTERVEIEVPTEDTMLIEREVEVDVDVDTTEIDGGDVEELDADLDTDLDAPATTTPQ